jgi:transcriptional regulator with XRE-family HTH domain
MTPAQYRKLRIARGTQQAVAKLLGVDVMTISRRERGEMAINREAWIALRGLPIAKEKK